MKTKLTYTIALVVIIVVCLIPHGIDHNYPLVFHRQTLVDLLHDCMEKEYKYGDTIIQYKEPTEVKSGFFQDTTLRFNIFKRPEDPKMVELSVACQKGTTGFFTLYFQFPESGDIRFNPDELFLQPECEYSFKDITDKLGTLLQLAEENLALRYKRYIEEVRSMNQ